MRKQINVGRVKGSMWYTGEGLPYVTHPLENDMYLNTIDCTVYQYENGEWIQKDIKLADSLLQELLEKGAIEPGEIHIDTTLSDGSNSIPTSKAVKDYVDEKHTQVMEVAQGKTKTYVLSVNDPNVSPYDSNKLFDSNNEMIKIINPQTPFLLIDGTRIKAHEFNIGDTLLITETDIPDRFVSSYLHLENALTFHQLESRKLDIEDLVTEKELEEALKDFTPSTGGSNVEVKKYTLPLGEASWVRIAKISDVTKNSSGIFTFATYGVKEDKLELLTSSVFSTSCGLYNGEIIADTTPITQAPELTGSDSSGGGSGGAGSGGATGSGDTAAPGTYGLTSIKIELYEGEMYVLGLVNYPSIDLYQELLVELKIENNLNFETLDELISIDTTDVNEEEMQLLEGTTLLENKDYEFVLKGDLRTYYDNINNKEPIKVEINLENGETLNVLDYKYVDETDSYGTPETYVYVKAGEFDMIKELASNGDGILNLSSDYYSNSWYLNDGDDLISMIESLLPTESERIYGYVKYIRPEKINFNLNYVYGADADIILNGNIIATLNSENNNIIIEDLKLDQDELYVSTSGNFMSWYQVSIDGFTYEIHINHKPKENQVIQSYSNDTAYNLQLKLAKLYIHHTSESYNLYSMYNKIKNINTRVSSLSGALTSLNYSIQGNTNKISEFSNMFYLQNDIGSGSFYYDTIVQNLYCPFVERIDSAAFASSTLTKIKFDMLKYIGDSAFIGCSNLTDVVFGANSGLKTIGDSAFQDCSSLTHIMFPDSLVSIGESAFQSCINIPSIIIPDSVTSISKGAFYGCSSLESITLPFVGATLDGTGNIGFKNIFRSYIPYSLKEVIITGGTDIGNSTFEDCSDLEKIVLPNSVTSIGKNAFKGCSNLTLITLPDSVTSIGSYAFSNCSNLTNLTVPKNVKVINIAAFSGCSNLQIIKTPSATILGDWAFSRCISLTDIHLGYDGLVKLANYNVFQTAATGIKVHVKKDNVSQYTEDLDWKALIDNGTVIILGDYQEV